MFRTLEGQEVDLLHQQAVHAVEAFRDERNPQLGLATRPECDDGVEALACPVVGFNAMHDLGRVIRKLQRQFPGCEWNAELLPGEKARYILTLPKVVQDMRPTQSPGGGGDTDVLGGGPPKPSTDRAMLLVVLLGILSAMLWARL